MRSLLVYSNGETFGDAVMKLPAVAALRAAFPNAHITWLAGRNHTLYASTFYFCVNGLIDRIIEQPSIGKHWSACLRRPLADERFDIVIDTQQILKATLALKHIPCKLFISGAANFRLSDRRPPGNAEPERHMLRRVLQLIALACGHPVEPRYGVRLPEAVRAAAHAALPEGHCYVGLAPGAGQAHKCWPLDRFITLAAQQRALGRVPVFFLGPQERSWMANIATMVPDALFPEAEPPEGVHPGPLLAIALAEQLAVSVSNDCGTGHMLAAGGRPLISLFGPTDPTKFAPSSPALTLLCAQNFGSRTMDAIPVSAVSAAIDRVLTA